MQRCLTTVDETGVLDTFKLQVGYLRRKTCQERDTLDFSAGRHTAVTGAIKRGFEVCMDSPLTQRIVQGTFCRSPFH